MFDALTPAPDRPQAWHVELHQFRIEARTGQTSQPTPEGLHRDGVDWVLVVPIDRKNVESGVTSIFGLDHSPLGDFTLIDPLDSAWMRTIFRRAPGLKEIGRRSELRSNLAPPRRTPGIQVGLEEFPPEDRPPVLIPFFTFRLMVGMGLVMLAVSWLGNVLRWRGRLETARWFLWCAFLAFPAGFIAVLAGWFTAEVGRQPWVIYGLLRTKDAVTPALVTHDVDLA